MVFGGASIGGLYAPVSDDQAAAALEAAWTAASAPSTPHRIMASAYPSNVSDGSWLGGRARNSSCLAR